MQVERPDPTIPLMPQSFSVSEASSSPRRGIPLAVVVALAVLAGGGMFFALSGPDACLSAAISGLMELITAAMIVVAAGGWGWPILRRIAPSGADGWFSAVFSCGLGLWMFSTALLIGGTLVGLPGMYLSWAVVLVGLALAARAGRGAILAGRFPWRLSVRSLIWIGLAVCAAIWLAGAMRPPGFIGRENAYDVLEYHLQVPREFYCAGRIGPLWHNCYSFFPLGTEMLFLLGMCLRGGAYEGMYLATLLHGAFGVLSAAGVYAALRHETAEKNRGFFAALLLASTPAVLYLSWLAFVELAMIFYLAMALLWLRMWLKDPGWRGAGCCGLALGIACGAKYLSVAFVAAPVLIVMGLAALKNRRQLRYLVLTGGLTVVLFSPWLIRNAAYTGNPVFPLATSVFGNGHWPAQSAQRWRDGHAASPHAPVPVPEGWRAPRTEPGRWTLLRANFFGEPLFGTIGLVIACVSILTLLTQPGSRRERPWDWSLAGVLVLQVTAWLAFSRGMPWRFLTPAIAPIALLAGGGLARLATGRRGRFFAPAAFLLAVLSNFVWIVLVYGEFTNRFQGIPPYPGEKIAAQVPPYSLASELPAGSRLMLVGDAAAFYWPAGTIYATAFDEHPLEEISRSPRRLKELQGLGVTHVLVNWPEVWRLAGTYGYPPELTERLYRRWQAGLGPDLPVLSNLRPVREYSPSTVTPQLPPQGAAWDPFHPPRSWPVFTLYEVPPATLN